MPLSMDAEKNRRAFDVFGREKRDGVVEFDTKLMTKQNVVDFVDS